MKKIFLPLCLAILTASLQAQPSPKAKQIKKPVKATTGDKTASPGSSLLSPIEQGEKIAISFDGKWIAFSTKATNLGVPAANIVMRNMSTGINRAISSVAGSSVGRPVISTNGSYVVFGIGAKLDNRFSSSGIFASYTGAGPCRACPE